MLKNVYLFTGEERYLLDQELNRRVYSFSQKFGEDSVVNYNNENWDEGSVKQSIFGGGLFSEKKIIVVSGLPLGGDKFGGFKTSQVEVFVEDFIKRNGEIPSENLLIFVSSKPDKRARMFKFLKDNANIKQFDLLKDFELKSYIKKELGLLKIGDKVLEKFVQKVGGELYRINSELQKLKMYCEYKSFGEITLEIVDEVVFGLLEAEVFEFLKLIFLNKNKAIIYLQKMQDQGLNWNAVSGLLYWGLKLYIVLYQFAKVGIKDAKLIASKTGIHPYSLSQNMKNIDIILRNGIEIENMYKKLIEVEVDIKSGKKLEESFWLETKKLINSFKI